MFSYLSKPLKCIQLNLLGPYNSLSSFGDAVLQLCRIMKKQKTNAAREIKERKREQGTNQRVQPSTCVMCILNLIVNAYIRSVYVYFLLEP